ncbi:MAG TPA: hypothetical protein VF746_03705 [Longimicrobium sp.]|jgi:hypothetical protein
MARKRAPDPEPDPFERIDSVLSAAEEASARYAEVKSELLHRLADIDGAVIELVQRVYDATPPEYQRSFLVHVDGDDEELALPDFLRLLMERPGGTRATLTISVAENLYDDGDEEEGEAGEDEEEEDEDAGEDEASGADDVDDELGF